MTYTLRRVETYTSSGGTEKAVGIPVARSVGGAIMPGADTSFEESSLAVPAVAQATMRSCSYIKVEYVLTVEVVIPWSFNLKLRFPIVIANSDPASVAGPAVSFNSQPQDKVHDMIH